MLNGEGVQPHCTRKQHPMLDGLQLQGAAVIMRLRVG
jgi:hypothetical protein